MRLHLTVPTAVTVLLFSLVASREAKAASFIFTKIADTQSAFSRFSSPSINNKGTVAFEAGLPEGGTGVFTGNGRSITAIATTRSFTSSSEPLSFSAPAINNNGIVAFTAARQTLEGGIFFGLFTGKGGSLTTIIDSSGKYKSFGTPAINDNGMVAFKGSQLDVGNGIFIGSVSGNPITTIADSKGSFANFNSLSINNKGTVAFSASLKNTRDGIFISKGGSITTIADTNGPFRYFVGAKINEKEAVAFRAGLQDQTSESLIIRGNNGFISLARANTISGKPFMNFEGYPSINKAGRVAFKAYLGQGKVGIFTGPNPVTDKVIASGDPLFGSTVETVDLSQDGRNDVGQIAFVAHLSDGTQTIVRGTLKYTIGGF